MSACGACREDVKLPFEFKMAFQPIVDMTNYCVWGYEALVRGVNGESAFSILSQVNEDIRYRFDQASRVTTLMRTTDAVNSGWRRLFDIRLLTESIVQIVVHQACYSTPPN